MRLQDPAPLVWRGQQSLQNARGIAEISPAAAGGGGSKNLKIR